jgi:Ca2+-transporting ATPase
VFAASRVADAGSRVTCALSSEESFQELQLAASRVQNRVFRNGAVTTIFVNEIVVNDLVLLQAGDKIPADGELIVGEIGSIQVCTRQRLASLESDAVSGVALL